MKEKNFKKIATDDSGWESLYFDAKLKTYWEETFPNSEYHGGGNPELRKVELTEIIKKKYHLE